MCYRAEVLLIQLEILFVQEYSIIVITVMYFVYSIRKDGPLYMLLQTEEILK